MYICFVEYRIEEQHLEKYRECMGSYTRRFKQLHIYEGTDQAGLFVELWQADSEEEAQRIKEERLSARSSLANMTQWVPGGAQKLHAWVFQPMRGVRAED